VILAEVYCIYVASHHHAC